MIKVKPLPISFEFFPPKSAETKHELMITAREFSQYQPQFFSVTFGAGGSTRAGTLDTVKEISMNTRVLAIPHLTCIGFDRHEMLQVLEQYHAAGVRSIVTLRGDIPPAGLTKPGEFQYASELVNLIRDTYGNYFHLAVAAYPEIHPQAISALEDVQNLKRKYDAGANVAITQYFFNPDGYFYYVDECTKAGINMSIIPGIMPVTQFARLARFSDMCGAEIPRWIRKRLESYGDDAESVQKFGLEVVSKLCQTLIAGGVPGMHFYTLNKLDGMVRLLQSLGFSSAANESREAIAI